VNAFIWPIAPAAVQKYCDTYFNLGDADERGFVYKAVANWPYATLIVIEYPVMVATGHLRTADDKGEIKDVAFADRAYTSQNEVFVALPVLRHGTRLETMLTKADVEWVLPFIIVDNPQSAVCGREMLGLEKLLAEIDCRESVEPDSFCAAVRLPGWMAARSGQLQAMHRFLEVKTGAAAPTVRGHKAVDSLWTLFGSRSASSAIGAMSGLSDFVEDITAGLLPTSMQTVSLKQIRDAAQPQTAVYQALVSCRSKYSNIENFRFYNEQDVAITVYDYGSFTEIFNVLLPAGFTGAYTLTPTAAFRFNATIDFDDMRTLHSFAVDRGGGLPPTRATDDMVATWLRPLQGFFGKRRP
jgi:hypothetical protein